MYMCAMIVKLASVLTIFLLEFVTMTILRCGIFSFSFLLLKFENSLTVYMSNTVGVLSEAGTVYTSRAPKFAPGLLVESVSLIF